MRWHDHADVLSSRPLALVTGASNSTGLKITRGPARRGHDLVLTGRSARTDEVADEMRQLSVDTSPYAPTLQMTTLSRPTWKSVIELDHPLRWLCFRFTLA